jgi:hypothetical protein
LRRPTWVRLWAGTESSNPSPSSKESVANLTLEDENAKLKKLLAEAMLDNAMLRDVAARKW